MAIKETLKELNKEATKKSMKETNFRERRNPQQLQRLADQHGATQLVLDTHRPEEIRLEHIRITKGASAYNTEYKKAIENEDISREEYTRRSNIVNQKIEDLVTGLNQEEKEKIVQVAYPDNELDLILDDIQRGRQGSQDFVDVALTEGAILSAHQQTRTQSKRDTSKMTLNERLNKLHKESQGQTYNEAEETYMCIWFPPTYRPKSEMNKKMSFFSDENGYAEQDRQKIERLRVGDYTELGQGGHLVIRTN